MSETKKYYWLKLKRDFFKRHDITVIESMPNGYKYILFYLKLLCEGIGFDGKLRFDKEIPYSHRMLSVITNTNTNVVEQAMKVLEENGLLSVDSNGTIILTKIVDKRIRTTKEYIEWRKSVFERDFYTCKSCGIHGVELNAHHIKKWADFVELRYNLDNGITLCKKCHKETHKKERTN